MVESFYAHTRREAKGFYRRYMSGHGIDVGCGDFKVLPEAVGVDIAPKREDCIKADALDLPFPDASFDYVYSSHCLEHVDDPVVALREWWRLLPSGGYLILYLPHRDHMEKKLDLPSSLSASHKRYFLPFIAEPPDTLSVYDLITTNLPGANIVLMDSFMPDIGKNRECSIEVVVQKTWYTPIFKIMMVDVDLGDRDMSDKSRVTRAEFEALLKLTEGSEDPFLEIGTSYGGTSIMLAEQLPEKLIISIDVTNYIEKSPRLLNLMRLLGSSVDYAGLVNRHRISWKFCVIFVDGSHEYKDVRGDSDAWAPHLSEGGYMVFHDSRLSVGMTTLDGTVWNGHRPGPAKVVEEMQAEGWELVDEVDSLSILRRQT